MRLTFVVPAYNEEAYLRDCLESIVSECRTVSVATEILVVNNASTDKTREVALSVPGVRVIEEARKGLSYARQAGYVASQGDLIANVDADSRLPRGWLEQVLETFDNWPEMMALSGPFVYYDLPAVKSAMVRVFYGIAWTGYAINRWVLRIGSMVQGGNFVVRRQGMERIGGFNVAITFYGEDTDVARRLSEEGEVRFTLGLKMLSSARRLKGEGLFRTALRYSMNYIWTTYCDRPFTTEHVDIREKQIAK